MKIKLSNTTKAFIIIIAILLIDQVLKIWVKTNMYLNESSINWEWWKINWFQIRFIENDGMAFGINLPGKYGKLFLTLFRIGAVVAIGWYLHSLIKKKSPGGLIVCFSMIMAGAIGNIIDSAFYGLIFTESHQYGNIASAFSEEGGYAPLLHGKVVDMLYFHAYWPDWMPFLKGKEIFPPIFNVADSSITIGVISILIFQKHFFKHEVHDNKKKNDVNNLEQESSNEEDTNLKSSSESSETS